MRELHDGMHVLSVEYKQSGVLRALDRLFRSLSFGVAGPHVAFRYGNV